MLAKLEKVRGFKTAFARSYQPVFSELYLRNDNGRTVYFRPGNDCPEKLLDKARKLFDEEAGWYLSPQRYGQLDNFIKAAAKCEHELRAYDDALDYIAEKRIQFLNEIFPLGTEDSQLEKLLKIPLYPYQKEGDLFAVRAGWLLIGNCKSLVISGNPAKHRTQYQQVDFCKITNYEKLRADLDLIEGWALELVMVNEAQRIKNWNTIAAHEFKRINSTYAVVLTGYLTGKQAG